MSRWVEPAASRAMSVIAFEAGSRFMAATDCECRTVLKKMAAEWVSRRKNPRQSSNRFRNLVSRALSLSQRSPSGKRKVPSGCRIA